MVISSASLLPYSWDTLLRLVVLCAASAGFAMLAHGWFQAVAATFFGDPAPRAQGRLFGSPLRHIDPIGIILATVSGFGWGQPLPGPPNRHGRWPSVAITAAGPLGNLSVAFLLATPIKADLLSWIAPSPDRLTLVLTGGLHSALSDIVSLLVVYNLLMAVFQLLPLAPLDGYRVLAALLPDSAADTHRRFQRFAPLLLVILIAAGYVIPPGIIWAALLPPAQWLGSLATGY